MQIPLYTLLESLKSDSSAPNIVLTVTLADLHQLVVDTIDATRERLLPLLIKANEERYLTPKEVAKQLGIGLTSVYNRIKDGKLKPIKMGKSTRFRQSDITAILEAQD